jgi:hypothetical protein
VDSRFLDQIGPTAGRLFAIETSAVVIVEIVGRQDGVLARTNRMMSGVFVAAATQTSQAAVAIVSQTMVRVRAANAAPSAAQPRKEQADENDVYQHFRDGFHIRIAESPGITNVDTDSQGKSQPRIPRGKTPLDSWHLPTPHRAWGYLPQYTRAEAFLNKDLFTFSLECFVAQSDGRPTFAA